ncbi:MAG: hypothetical protein JWQ39_600 [Glaciihabitans sp.]|nr:hypothetical protein [Glaciihabitans sp.]
MPVWHPILAAVEVEPGHWRMVAQYGQFYGDVRFNGAQYTATGLNGVQPGPFTSSQDATAAAHRVFIRSHGAPEVQGYLGTRN